MAEEGLVEKVFGTRFPIIGMLHLNGNSTDEIYTTAMSELEIYESAGVDGVIVEDYFGGVEDVERVLKGIDERGTTMTVGVNVLRNPYFGFGLATQYGGEFVQFDSVHARDLNIGRYQAFRREYPSVMVLGGIQFKYVDSTGQSLSEDLQEGKKYSDVVVTTGQGTAQETPLKKLRDFYNGLSGFPLFVGAGVTAENVAEQLCYCEGAIVGSYFKVDGKTELGVDEQRVKGLMDVVGVVRSVGAQYEN